MAKSRVRPHGVTHHRPRRKMLGKGCASKNAKAASRMPRRVHLKFPKTA